MTIEEIVHGESKNVEFKVSLPRDSAKYMKTIIAFANTQGGRLVIGVEDKTRSVTGVDDDFAFQIMDNIANAVSDSCTPQIVPDIELRTIDKHTVIVVTVAPGPNRPCGHSKLRNKGIANVFNQMGFIEAWGTGMRRIRQAAERYGLPDPEIQVFDDMFRVNLYRRPLSEVSNGCSKASEKHRKQFGEDLNDTQKKILELLSADG